ncbi:protein kinase C-binding protein NELL2-like [Oppia nitens]|uniref:protein kinase C-binding protein NELL2-like n=1 Tax=Oppia nitens TaxID=1686743 RepID=UPI0023DC6653|nr:protein kinase C-binding protein NELL2-like [Oppia nitens]
MFMVKNIVVSILLLITTLVTNSSALGTQLEESKHQIDPTCGQFKSLQNSVIRLENIIKELSERLFEAELRLQNVEECDCFKSCVVNGSIHEEGSSWQHNCDICSCVRGQVICRPIQCQTPCKNAEYIEGQCCPVCKKTCYLNQQVLQHGERIRITPKTGTNKDKCGECVCNDGKTSCKQIISETMCPKLNCPPEQQIYRENECCKICAGTDFCGSGNDCHPTNGTCHNMMTEYICICNDGFDGDGRICTDINECDHKGGTDGNHCGQNTQCLNTLGSYKCECLQGFRRHNRFECIAGTDYSADNTDNTDDDSDNTRLMTDHSHHRSRQQSDGHRNRQTKKHRN